MPNIKQLQGHNSEKDQIIHVISNQKVLYIQKHQKKIYPRGLVQSTTLKSARMMTVCGSKSSVIKTNDCTVS